MVGRSKTANGRMTWAHAWRDMVVSSINKGQLPVFGLFLLALAVIYKMPSQDVSRMVFRILASLRHGEGFSYPLFLASLVGWYTHARYQRKAFSDECSRIGKEKSNLQSRLAGKHFKSSNKS